MTHVNGMHTHKHTLTSNAPKSDIIKTATIEVCNITTIWKKAATVKSPQILL
jgi:hypothetical protein